MFKTLTIADLDHIKTYIKHVKEGNYYINSKIDALFSLLPRYFTLFSTAEIQKRRNRKADVMLVSQIEFEDRRIIHHAYHMLRYGLYPTECQRDLTIAHQHLGLVRQCQKKHVKYLDMHTAAPADQKTVDVIANILTKTVDRKLTQAKQFPKITKLLAIIKPCFA